MQMKQCTIYVTDVYGTCDLPERCFPSLIQAVKYIYSKPDLGTKDLLLCMGSYNMDYVQTGESMSHYYRRMKAMFHEIFDQPGMR